MIIKKYKKNEEIRAEKVRIIGADGAQLGILPIQEAKNLAKKENLDLLLLSDQATPPVCKIVNFGQFRYEQQKKDKKNKKNTKTQVIKELKLTPKISEHDYQVRVRNGSKFLQKGYQLKITVFFKGREMTHPELGKDLLNRYKDDIKEYGEAVNDTFQGHRTLYLMINPK
jgi:translation initiation factor IF-3